MKQTALLVVAVICAAVGAAAATTCDNPVFTDPSAWGQTSDLPITIVLPPAPVPFTASVNVCSSYRGRQVCCSNATLHGIQGVWDAARERFREAMQELHNNRMDEKMRDRAQQLKHERCDQQMADSVLRGAPVALHAQGGPGAGSAGSIGSGAGSGSGRRPSACNTMDAAIQGRLHRVQAAMQQVERAAVRCSRALTAYTVGIMCFSCEPDWQPFVDNTTKTITLATRVCESTTGACTPLFAAVRNLLKASSDIIRELAGSLGNGDVRAALTADDIADMCGGTGRNPSSPGQCRRHMCESMLNGVGLPSIAWRPDEVGFTSRRLAAAVVAAAHEHSEQAAVHTLAEAYAAAVELSGAVGGRQLTSTGINRYADNGYDAYHVGCKDMDCGGALRWAPGFTAMLVSVITLLLLK